MMVAMPKLLHHALTDIQLKRWVAAKTPLAKADGGNLYFTLSKAGTASWILRVSTGAGKRDELTLGNYPDIGLSEARKLAGAHRAAIDQGINPAKEKAARKKAAANPVWTIKKLAEDYSAKRLVLEAFGKGTLYYRKADLKNVIVPRLGSQPVKDVTGQDVVKMLRDTHTSWTVSKRVLTTAAKLFEHAAGLHLVHINPCTGISLTSLFGPRPAIKKRVMLSKDDLRTLLREIDSLGTVNATAFRLLLATCVRTNELTQARWENVNLETGSWYVPDEATKTRNGFLVPLTPPVIEWFRELKKVAGDSPYVLPARDVRRQGQPITERTLWAAIDRAFADGRLTVQKFTPHDTRSTAKGHMRNLGISHEDSERALNHVIPGMAGIYDVRDELPEKRRALQAWSDFLLTLSPVKSLDNSEQLLTTD